MSPHGHETALRGPIELFHALIAAAATALSVENTQRSCARHSIGPTLSISRSSPSLPHTGHKHRCRTSLVFIIDLMGSAEHGRDYPWQFMKHCARWRSENVSKSTTLSWRVSRWSSATGAGGSDHGRGGDRHPVPARS
jgi:hypothetical protein